MTNLKIMSGNELIVQGGIEAGFNLYTGYPGSPLADYFNILHHKKNVLEKFGSRVVIGNSEANAAAMASGSKQAGKNVCVAMKSMGLHVASDALSVGNFADPGEKTICPDSGEQLSPGVVIVVGDDPWSQSTSTPADSRFLFKHLHIPFLEPSTPQELKDWMKTSLEISQYSSIYQGVILNTFMAEGGGRVEIGEPLKLDKELVNLEPNTFDLKKNVMVPPNSLGADQRMLETRFPRAKEKINELKLDKIYGDDEAEVGVISSGVVFESVKEVLEKDALLDSLSLYKVACSYPLSDDRLGSWIEGKKVIIVIEEKRAFLETEVRHLISEKKIDTNVWGKSFDNNIPGFPSHGGINVEIIREKLKIAFEQIHFSGKVCQSEFNDNVPGLPTRLPTFCPGCPHRETLSVLKELRGDLEKKGINLISHGDVGCYSLSFLEPFKEMHNLSAMGQGGALGAGVDLFTKNPSVVLMGDSTFFHSGLTDISNSVQTGHDITYILLDNDNTAMTGHQMTPASGLSVEGKTRPRQKMVEVVKSLGVDEAFEINPSDRYFYKNELAQTVEKKGVKVIVSNKECALTFHGREKKRERSLLRDGTIPNKTFFQINSDLCENCHACVEMTGCPGLTKTEDAYGDKIMIDPQICVSDSYCTKIKACPSFEEVIVHQYHPTKYKPSSKDNPLDNIPEVNGISLQEIKDGRTWRAVVTGVGGSGVTTISRIIAEASKDLEPDFDFKFMDQKGLAQRNGRVTGHLALHPKGSSAATVTPLGEADLMLSPDLLDGSQAIQFLSKEHGKAIIGDDLQIPLSFILDKGAPSKSDLIKKVEENSQVELVSIKSVASSQLGKAVYANAMALGVAYQKGYLPFCLTEMTDAFSRAVSKQELENNLHAFQLGRLLVNDPNNSIFHQYNDKLELSQFEESLIDSFPFFKSTSIMVKFFRKSVARLQKYFPFVETCHLYQYVHDLFIYDRGKNIEEFLQNAGEISISKINQEEKKAALGLLAKTYFVKDEVFCSHQMISPIKKYRDEKQWGKIGRDYNIIRINRPHFDIFGKELEFDLSPSTWMLKSMRHLRVLRFLLPSWHYKEREIAKRMRAKIMQLVSSSEEVMNNLRELNNINGYREVRYEKFAKVFNE